MATGQSQVLATFTGPAKRDLSAYQYCAMTIDTDGYIDYANSATGTQVLGILQNKPAAAGDEAEVAILGTSLFYMGATAEVSQMDKLGSEAVSYRGVKVSANLALYFCFALEAATTDGDLIEVLLIGGTASISA